MITGVYLVGLGAALILGWQAALVAHMRRVHRRPPPASLHPPYDWQAVERQDLP